MKRQLIAAALVVIPLIAQATDIRINTDGVRVQSGSTTIRFGDRDKRGYYWDGDRWRDPVYWDKHHGKGKGNQGCPPGQAKKGNC
jgi:hypothetical protein